MNILHIDSSARREGSNSRVVGAYLAQQLQAQNANTRTIYRDLVSNPLPPMSAGDLVGVHGSHERGLRESLDLHLDTSAQLIDELKRSDTLILATPMYNFSVPSYLKQWIDYVCRAGVTFRYGSDGPEGLTGVERAFIVTASGGTTIGSQADFASTYLEHICRFLGIDSVYQIDASGSKREPEVAVAQAKASIDELLGDLAA